MRTTLTILCLAISLISTVYAREYRVEEIENVQIENRERFVTNPDGILSAEAVKTLDSLCYSLRTRGIAQVAIVAVKEIEPNDPLAFAMELFERWGVGNKERDNGLGILLVEDLREIRFVTGYGIESALPDIMCTRIQRNYMLPHFREGDYSTGMVEGLRAVDSLLTGGELDQGLRDDVGEEGDDALLALVLTILLVVLPLVLFIIHERQITKCPNCGKHGLKVKQRIVTKNTPLERTTVEHLVCSYCGSEHKRTKHEDRHTGGGGPIIFGGGGFGSGGSFGGGSFGGGFGGGSFGGGGGGSRW